MKNVYSLSSFVFTLLFTSSFFNCKNETKENVKQETSTAVLSTVPTKNKESKEVTGLVEAQIDGKSFKTSELDQKLTTDVTLLDNGIQFRINDVNKQSVLVNMYAPDLLKQVPITISQQSSALSPEDTFNVKTQSRLEINIPSEQPVQGDVKVLYEGTVTLAELSESKLVVTFSGKGFPNGSNKKSLFPMEGKIVLENFNVYDGRMN